MVRQIPKLAGLAEVATLAGVTRQRAWQLTQHREFPRPVQVLAMGPVWAEADVTAFLAIPRPSGRRPKAGNREERAMTYRIFHTSGEPYIGGDRDHQFTPAEAASIVEDSPWAAIDTEGDVIIGSYRTRVSWNGGKPVEGWKLAKRLQAEAFTARSKT